MVSSDLAKSGPESACSIEGYESQNKDKTIPLRKIRVCYFFHAVYRSKNHVIPHRVIAAILDVILNISQR